MKKEQSQPENKKNLKEELETEFRKNKSLFPPLLPEPGGLAPEGEPLKGIKAVLFDVYGTLLISGSGDIGVHDQPVHEKQEELLKYYGYGALTEKVGGIKGLSRMFAEVIREDHARSRREGFPFPEVEIREIWRKLSEVAGAPPLSADEIERLALLYEMSSNPVALMPGAEFLLSPDSKLSSLFKGIVSNAQFYTPMILFSLLGCSPADAGFDESLCSWSYRERRAKPDPEIFAPPLRVLQECGIRAEEVLYVGNDMLKDIYCARSRGCRTALFAGDRRSLRRHREKPECRNLRPDVILNDLRQLEDLL